MTKTLADALPVRDVNESQGAGGVLEDHRPGLEAGDLLPEAHAHAQLPEHPLDGRHRLGAHAGARAGHGGERPDAGSEPHA